MKIDETFDPKLNIDIYLSMYSIIKEVLDVSNIICSDINKKYMMKYWNGFGMNDRIVGVTERVIMEYEYE